MLLRSHVLHMLGTMMAATLFLAGCERSETPSKPATPVMAPESAPAVSEEPTDTPLTPEPGTQVVTLTLDGMHCQSCADTISMHLRKLDGVRKAHASFDAKTGWVMVESGGPSVDLLVKTVVDAGYKASPAVNAASAPAPQ